MFFCEPFFVIVGNLKLMILLFLSYLSLLRCHVNIIYSTICWDTTSICSSNPYSHSNSYSLPPKPNAHPNPYPHLSPYPPPPPQCVHKLEIQGGATKKNMNDLV